MRTLYLDCGMGAAGDMLTAALLELMPNPQTAVEALNGLGVPGVRFEAEESFKCGITGTHMRVTVDGAEEHEHTHHHHDHEHSLHHHSGMEEIDHWISHVSAPESVKRNIHEVYHAIAQAESTVHGVAVDQIHFHEVGSLDAVADVTAVCWLMDQLHPDRVVVSPVHVGSGHVSCAHGILPVPAPATAEILKGVPIYGGAIQGELCTPTGAALLKQFATQFGSMPVMAPRAVGYGMGRKDFAMANCVRAILGDEADSGDRILELACNLDDMTPEDIGFAMERLLDAGALDVYTTPIGMKKNRPGVMLTVLCKPEKKQEMTGLLLLHTTTLGIRETVHSRTVLQRTTETKETPWGSVRFKNVSGCGIQRSKPEYEDLAKISRETGIPVTQLRRELEKL